MIDERPLISIVMAAWNAGTTIGAAVSSVLTQTYDNWELLVVDDGSTDATCTVVEAHDDSRIRLLHQTHAGVSAARNLGVQSAHGSLVAWLDADDMLLPRHLDELLKAYRASPDPRTVISADGLRLTPAGITGKRLLEEFPAPDRQRAKLLEDNFVGVFCLYPVSLHDEVGFLDTALSGGEDRDLWVRAAFHGWTFVRQPVPTAIYRWLGDSSSNRRDAMNAGERVILDKLAGDDSVELTTAERDYLQLRRDSPTPRQLLDEANEALRTGDDRTASRLLRQASALKPSDTRLRLRAGAARVRPGRMMLSWLIRRSDNRVGWHEGMRH